jgi:hypothetical protein
MAACHVGETPADGDWEGFSLRKLPGKARNVFGMTRHRIREVLAGFSGDVHGVFSAGVAVEKRPDPSDKLDTFFSEFLLEGMDGIIDKLLDQVRQMALREVRIEDRIEASSDKGLEHDGKVLDGLTGETRKRLKSVLLKCAHHVGREMMDVNKVMECESRSRRGFDHVSKFCRWAPAQIQHNHSYDRFIGQFLRGFIKDRAFVDLMLSDDELLFSPEQKQAAWYLQFENSMSELYQLFLGIVEKRGSLPDDKLRVKGESGLRKVFQALRTCRFLLSADELERQMGLRVVKKVSGTVAASSGVVPGVREIDKERGK